MSIRIAYRNDEGRTDTVLKIVGAALVGAAAAVGLGIFLARDQMMRNRRELFSPHPLRRLAALGYLRAHPQADDVPLLRDYVAWEERPLLRKRAAGILAGLEDSLSAPEREGVEGA